MNSEARIHFSNDEDLKLNPAYYLNYTSNIGKPCGFWYAVGDGWREYCNENIPLRLGKYRYEIDLSRANMLFLRTPQALLEMEKLYRNENSPLRELVAMDMFIIDWNKVAAKYDGVEIAPYQDAIRLKYMWYYGWDCASGCIWNLERISI